MYALDGLSSPSLPTQRDSAVQLAEILATRKGRRALRCGCRSTLIIIVTVTVVVRPGTHNKPLRHYQPDTCDVCNDACGCARVNMRRTDSLALQVLSRAAPLRVHTDATLSMAFTVILYALSRDDAHPGYLASNAAAALADQLLSGHDALPGPAQAAQVRNM